MSAEVTTEAAQAAVAALSDEMLARLAEGPTDDPDDCWICEVFDPWLFGFPPGEWKHDEGGDLYLAVEHPDSAHVYVLTDYHRDQANGGEGAEAYRRCLEVYEWVRTVRRDRENAGDGTTDSTGGDVAADGARDAGSAGVEDGPSDHA